MFILKIGILFLVLSEKFNEISGKIFVRTDSETKLT